jgi:hypothetical protein
MYQLALPGVVACVTDRYWIVRRGNIGTFFGGDYGAEFNRNDGRC